MNKNSYTAASTFPSKIFCQDGLIKKIRNHQIPPIHIQVNPTNVCNMNCSYCSCAKRDKTLQISYDKLTAITHKFVQLGAKAVTITGGGEPLCYPKIGDYIVNTARTVDVALTTNGLLLHKMKKRTIEKLMWCRISLSNEHRLHFSQLEQVVNIPIDWSFSYVLTSDMRQIHSLIGAIRFANEHNFTHIRVVDDIIKNGNVMADVRKRAEAVVDCSRVIWQGRKKYAKGHKRCLLSLLKPNITPEGFLVGCCGIQFASKPAMLDWPRFYSMGDNIDRIYKEQQFFDGSSCEVCYYSEYNNVLNSIWDADNLQHKAFL